MTVPVVLALPPVYTRVIPFEFEFDGVQGSTHDVWVVKSGNAFELAAMVIRGSASMDINVCDGTPATPIGFVQVIPGNYWPVQIGLGRVRSATYTGSKLILLDPVGVGIPVRIKGIVYGYELTREGNYV